MTTLVRLNIQSNFYKLIHDPTLTVGLICQRTPLVFSFKVGYLGMWVWPSYGGWGPWFFGGMLC